MKMTQPRALRRRFLQESATRMFLASPSTSRHLSAEDMELRKIDPDQADPPASARCQACGSLLVPDWTATTKLFSRPTRKTPPQSAVTEAASSTRRLVRRCKSCHRFTKQQTTGVIKPRGWRQPAAMGVRQSRIEESPPKEGKARSGPNVSSKKRAKARRDREGLQALLDRSKATKPSAALSLMDLMKI